jgi:hypothetical protein
VHVALEHGVGEDIGGEVAIGALGATERHRDIKAERHPNDYPTLVGYREDILIAPAFFGGATRTEYDN